MHLNATLIVKIKRKLFPQYQIPILQSFCGTPCTSETYSRMNTSECILEKIKEWILIVNWNNNQPNIIRNEDNNLNFILTRKISFWWVEIEKNLRHYPYIPYNFLVTIKNPYNPYILATLELSFYISKIRERILMREGLSLVPLIKLSSETIWTIIDQEK